MRDTCYTAGVAVARTVGELTRGARRVTADRYPAQVELAAGVVAVDVGEHTESSGDYGVDQ